MPPGAPAGGTSVVKYHHTPPLPCQETLVAASHSSLSISSSCHCLERSAKLCRQTRNNGGPAGVRRPQTFIQGFQACCSSASRRFAHLVPPLADVVTSAAGACVEPDDCSFWGAWGFTACLECPKISCVASGFEGRWACSTGVVVLRLSPLSPSRARDFFNAFTASSLRLRRASSSDSTAACLLADALSCKQPRVRCVVGRTTGTKYQQNVPEVT